MKDWGFVGVALFVVAWASVTYYGFIDPALVASPWSVAQELCELAPSREFWNHVGSTLLRAMVAFLIGSTFGVIGGLLLGLDVRLRSMFESLVDFFRSVPVVALFPLFMVLFGVGDQAKIATAAWACFPVVMINTIYGVKQCNHTRMLATASMGASSLQVFTRVIFWESLPSIVAGLRTGFSLCLIVVLMTEMFLATHFGLGRMIYDAGIIYQIPRVYSGILLTGFIGYGFNRLFLIAELKFIHWTGK